jgi:DNA replication protein DnaC
MRKKGRTMTQLMTPDPQKDLNAQLLAALLRSLRLWRMADELPAILEEAATEGWGHLELLHKVLRSEEVRRSQNRFERNLKASGLSTVYGLDHYDFELAAERGLKAAVVRDLAQCEFIRARRNVILAGGVGTGKTYLAKTLGVEALKRGFKVFFFNTSALVERLYAKRSSFHFGKIYGKIRDVDLVILDDLAYLPYSPEKVEYLFSLVIDRHELKSGSTIVTSNTDVQEWWQFFPSKAMGMAFSDRVLHGAQGIRLSGESIRKPRGKPKGKKPGEEGDVAEDTTKKP